MFSHYIKISFRNLFRDKLYASINIIGLAISIACCLLLTLNLYSELTYDGHNENADRIHRVVQQLSNAGGSEISAVTSRMVGPLLVRDYPEFESFVRLRPSPSDPMLIARGDTALNWDSVMIADQNVFEVFTHELLAGNSDTALVDPNSVAVSQSFVNAYFGNGNSPTAAIGETIEAMGSSFRIDLIFADLPKNAHLQYDILLSYNFFNAPNADNPNALALLWDPSVYTYVMLPAEYDVNEFDSIAADFWNRYMADAGAQRETRIDYYLEPLRSIHLQSQTVGSDAIANKYYVTIFFAIAVIMLLVACANYMNMATARSAQRAKEIGVHKVLGASRKQLIIFFLSESVFFSLLALILALVLVEIIRFTPLNQILGGGVSLSLLINPTTGLIVVFGSIVLGLVSGLYPALYLSAILTTRALQGIGNSGGQIWITRKGLTLFQLMSSLSVIACALLMTKQLDYIRSYSPGFDKENKLIVRLQGADIVDKLPILKNEFGQQNSILGSTISLELPGQMEDSLYLFTANRDSGEAVAQGFRVFRMGDDYLDVMRIELVAGSDFEEASGTGATMPILVNEETVRRLAWTNPIGQLIENDRGTVLQVVGVVKDFNFQDLSVGIEPLMVTHDEPDYKSLPASSRPYVYRWLILDVAEGEMAETIAYLDTLFSELDPDQPFSYQLLEDTLNEMYRSQYRAIDLIGSFALISILISCLGLFGLSAFTTQQRRKEIGIRKILGASVLRIIIMLSQTILSLVAIAAITGSLLSWWIIGNWLESFAYRASIDPLVFVLATVIVGVIALATMILESYKTANANPADTLRCQ